MKYRSALTSFTVLTLSMTAAQASNKSDIQELKQRVDCLESKNTCCSSNGCSTCSYDPDYNTAFYIAAEALYLKAAESGLTNVIKAIPEGGAMVDSGRSRHPRFNWHWGFRVDVGYNMCHDLWDIYASWTRYHFKDHRTTTLGEPRDPFATGFPTLFPFWTFSDGTPINESETTWKVHLDMIDLQLGREFFVTNYLSLKPHIGLRTGWIRQTYNIEDSAFASANLVAAAINFDIDMKNNFWGIGVVAGLDTKWQLGCGFAIYGNFAFSVLDGHFHTSYDFTAGTPLFIAEDPPLTVLSELENTNHQNMAVFVADLSLGLRWESPFACDRFLFGIWAGYEQHVYFEQNQFTNYQFDYNSRVVNYYADGGNLSTNGIVVGAELRF